MIDEILERVQEGSITKADASYLSSLSPQDLFHLADQLRREAVGDTVTYVINRNINFTNSCIGDCAFCAFRSDTGYILSEEQILQKVQEAVEIGATEICIQGGLLRGMMLDDYCGMLESIKSNFAVHIHAFSPMEVFHAARNSSSDIGDALKALKNSGLNSMPGTAAEILDDSIRRKICPSKISTEQWVDIVTTAHRLGIPTTATMLYGHVESFEDRIDHILLIRDIQQKTRGFTEFIPLPFMAKNNSLGTVAHRANSIDDIKVHALSRILLHNSIKNVQASWVKLGVKLAQVTLLYGVNDLGGTLMEEKITKSAGGTAGEYLSPNDLEEIITDVGRIPRRRTTLYELI
ncbi:MAG: 5-amino-6-(D-ribitylamino)uracil--L-tyrosine 4-hydroxyphenyl transferase CofH [Methanocellales archaeon]|nr:5-amino-6-(D-ribitylamino)uracil--L-tyrosine 4-hydroxyphenyl transferase CofH [Methanocellales archaeon]MDD4898689.1 5-amino-6-(D-ribitylamino)uracil--L-tyrosine 4-hydroxyphenyl transferase CofH [Methanocellales archaeon]MDD5447075.1 5-amino-6-(D-ribitylamino)uracil--L-tyrosine 4-hydroxyphenyl transferase CofH [Methanocellales archaeon]